MILILKRELLNKGDIMYRRAKIEILCDHINECNNIIDSIKGDNFHCKNDTHAKKNRRS